MKRDTKLTKLIQMILSKNPTDFDVGKISPDTIEKMVFTEDMSAIKYSYYQSDQFDP